MQPPSRRLAPGAGTAMPPPPRPSGGGARGPEAPPHSPPPPTQAHERTEADRRNGGPAPPLKRPLHPGCGGTTAEAGARTFRPLPADGGPAAPRTAQTERPYQRPPPPSTALARWRPTGPRPTPAAARQPPRHEYTPGGHAGDNGWQADARRGRGAGGAAPPPPPPPLPPPSLGATRAALRPPGAEGTPPPPPPQKGPRRGERGDAAGPAHRAPRRPQPPAPAGVAAAE